MEDELQKIEWLFKNQIVIYEKKVYENWFKVCVVERVIVEEKREVVNLRYKLLELI